MYKPYRSRHRNVSRFLRTHTHTHTLTRKYILQKRGPHKLENVTPSFSNSNETTSLFEWIAFNWAPVCVNVFEGNATIYIAPTPLPILATSKIQFGIFRFDSKRPSVRFDFFLIPPPPLEGKNVCLV